MSTTRRLTPDEIEQLRAAMHAQGIDMLATLHKQRQQYARGQVSIRPRRSASNEYFQWTENAFARVLAFVREQQLCSELLDYLDSEHVYAIYAAGFGFMSRRVLETPSQNP